MKINHNLVETEDNTNSNFDLRGLLESEILREVVVGFIDEFSSAILEVKNREVFLSVETARKQIKQHPEIGYEEYLFLPDIFTKGEIIRDTANTLVFYRKINRRFYKAAIKTTKSRKKVFLLSFHRLKGEREIERLRRKGEKIRR